MQELAKYSFTSQLGDYPKAAVRYTSVNLMIDQWLKEKGATNTSIERGTFSSKRPGASGHFTQTITKNDVGELREILLIDMIKGKHAFATNLRVGLIGSEVIIYCALSVKRLSQIIAPLNVYPRCPKIIRDIVEGYGDWTLEGDLVPRATVIDAAGDRGGYDLSKALLDKKRKFPVVVISDDPDHRPWINLTQKLANDLVGVAHVASLDDEGSWALTDELGKSYSCYLGAVRLYWPLTTDDLNTSVWTATRLLQEYGEDISGLNRFLTTIREIVLETSSLSLSNPKNLREVSKQDLRLRLSTANAEEQEKELNSIIDENGDLCDQLNEAKAEIARLKSKVLSLYSQQNERDQEESPDDSEVELVHTPAEAGDLRYYKKISKNGNSDKLVVTKECNHNSWRPTPKAIQAQKGIQKLEGRDDWRSFQHCNGCKGGGRWRVQW